MDVNEDLSKDALVSRREEKEEENSEGEGDEDAALRAENFGGRMISQHFCISFEGVRKGLDLPDVAIVLEFPKC